MGTAKRAPDAINLGAVEIGVSDYASQGNAILGIRDSGKSYTATYLAEQLLARDIPFVAFDPIGVWRFLRHAGKGGRGWDLVVAGGENGDVPLTPDNCETLVRHAMTTNHSLVLDLYSMALSKADWRRIVEKCVRLMLYENKAHGLRHVFIEEAAEFVPQMIQREYASVYAEIEKLARMGGNAMLGYTLINQRAEQVNKAVLELCDCLFLHRQKGRLSLQALTKWLEFGDRSKTSAIVHAIPLLDQGECYIWKGGSEFPELTKIPRKQSFHPNRREQTDPGPRTDVKYMLAGLRLEPEAKPKAPKSQDPRDVPKDESEIVRVPVFAAGELANLERLTRDAQSLLPVAQEVTNSMMEATSSLVAALRMADSISHKASQPRPTPKPREADKPTVAASGPQRILSALASRHPLRLTQNQLGTICGFTPSTMRTYLPRIREQGLLDENREGIGLTSAGCAHCNKHVPKVPMPTGGRELLEFWKAKLNQGEAAILQALYEFGLTGGSKVTPQTLAAAVGYTDSTLRTYLPTLRRNNLIDPIELRIMPEFLK